MTCLAIICNSMKDGYYVSYYNWNINTIIVEKQTNSLLINRLLIKSNVIFIHLINSLIIMLSIHFIINFISIIQLFSQTVTF